MPHAPPVVMDNDILCPACNRQIQRKSTQVPVIPPAPPAPPPSSPQSPTPAVRLTNNRTVRKRGGLVHGTGRVKPDGSLKFLDSKPQPPAQPSPPISYRTVIGQGPDLLYCSDECMIADINKNHGAVANDYNPDHQSLPALSHRTVAFNATGSSIESQPSSSSSASSSQPKTHSSPSLSRLAAIYNWGPPPPPAHVDGYDDREVNYQPHDYSSGIIMAGRRISEFCSKPRNRITNSHAVLTEPHNPIPGWTDGSNEWRSSVYSLVCPRHPPNGELNAYKPFTRSFYHSRQSNIGLYVASPSSAIAALPEDTTEMIDRFVESFARRSSSRTVEPFHGTARSRRERSLLQPGAEGKLLVPDVKMKVHGGSSALSSRTHPPPARRSSVRSPLPLSSNDDGNVQRCDSAASSPPTTKRPVVETRSWSYDNVRTYPVMRMPQKILKRVQKRVVDGVETEIEVEVEEPLKRLFLFPAPMRA